LPDITHTTTGASGIGIATGLPAGVSAAWASNTITISGTPTESGTFNYSIPLSGGCGSVNATGTITVRDIVSPPTQNVTTNITTGTVLITAGTITATNQVSNANVEFRAGSSVTLLPAFRAIGNTFTATIGAAGCN
jgi:hypothetical protein